MTELTFPVLMSQLRRGDDAAAAQVFHRYVRRLSALARKRLSPQVQRKVAPEDVLQSVYKSFFLRQREGEFELSDWDDLWALLAVITVRKCVKHARAVHREKRDAGREVSAKAGSDGEERSLQLLAHDPTPDEAAALSDTLEQIMTGLDGPGRAVVTLRLQGYTEQEIGEQVGRTERTVRRVLARVRQRLEKMEASDGVA